MPKISHTGYISGSSMATWSNQTVGTFSAGESEYVKCSVTGATPTSGYVYVLDLRTSETVEKPSNGKPSNHECGGAFSDVFCSANYTKSSLPSATSTVGAVPVGDWFSNSGNLHLKVSVVDTSGDPIACPAGEGYSWVWLTTGTVISEMDDTTPVTRCFGQATDLKLA